MHIIQAQSMNKMNEIINKMSKKKIINKVISRAQLIVKTSLALAPIIYKLNKFVLYTKL